MEGFIPTSKLTTDNIRNPAEAFKPGDTVPAAVIEVEAASRKLTLSVVDYFKNKEDSEWKSYLAANKPGDPMRRHAEARERVRPKLHGG